MNVLEMTDSELYEMGVKILTEKLGGSEVQRFIRQCKPGKGDYSVDRHKLLANQPDIATIVKRIQDKRAVWEAEERERAKRFAAPQSEIRKMTDIEIFEIGNQVLINKLGASGFIGFTRICQELNGGYPRGLIESREEAKESIKLYTASLTLNPRIVEDYIKRGNAYNYIGEHDKAIADYDQAIKLKPNYAKAYYNRGNAYRDKVDFDQAIADYTKALELKPDYVEAYYNRGISYQRKGEYDAALQDHSKAIKLDPDYADAYYYRGLMYIIKNEHDAALRDFSRVIKSKPDYAEAYKNRGVAYHMKGEYNAALRDYNTTIKINPDYVEAYNARGITYRLKNNIDLAIKDYDTAIKLEPNNTVAYCNRGEAWLHLKEWEKAREDLNHAKDSGIDIIASFHNDYDSIEDFEKKNDIQLPEDIAAMLRQQ